ncbi:subtilisin-like serine protease [Saccharomonospora marina XMU15]|uniref:Subtilisin-like serine protease n=1 Tax=Saccharomonospora marina XMU15 TaxID=882083 RepID=H5X766_9PSEU|nr:S8 family serine peptidase [Saccharomonospora marina]EHR49026.1 subtilisin-like serine protease [Saccharomonospora marina XMU15]
MRRAWPLRRASALALTVAIGTVCPGLSPVPAMAQDSPPDGEGYYATPPPLGNTAPPTDTGRPDKPYVKQVGCVERDLGRDVIPRETPWGQQYLRINEVHDLMRSTVGSVGRYPGGEPVRVAVIDTGITNHPFFNGRVQGVEDYVADTASGPGLEDCDGHGTEVAGIIAANTTPDIGFNGVAPEVQILSIRQSSQNYSVDDSASQSSGGNDNAGGEDGNDPGSGGDTGGEGQPNALRSPTDPTDTAPAQNGGRTQEEEDAAGTLDTLAQAVVRATDENADVINISINNCRPADGNIGEGERKLQAAVRYAVDNDVVVVAAAGNTGENCPQNDQRDPGKPKTIVTPPWFAEDVLSVAAIDETGSVADFSVHGPWVTVAAPGTGITSLDPAVGSGGLANLTIENGEPQQIQGTSFAAPYVSGVAALVRAKYPDLTARQVMYRIAYTAQHPAASGGRDNFIGYGIIDPMAALTATVPSEEGIEPARAEALPSDLPMTDNRDWTPMVVALAGSGGALMALIITLFVVHTIRRNRTAQTRPEDSRKRV